MYGEASFECSSSALRGAGASHARAHERRLPHSVCIRECRSDDLERLEWSGLYSHDRETIRAQFVRHSKGTNPFWVAEWKRFPVGQVWVDLERKALHSVGVIWALRVVPPLQGRGIGTALIVQAEQVAKQAGLRFTELAFEPHDVRAEALYRKLGYVDHGLAGCENGHADRCCGRDRAAGLQLLRKRHSTLAG